MPQCNHCHKNFKKGNGKGSLNRHLAAVKAANSKNSNGKSGKGKKQITKEKKTKEELSQNAKKAVKKRWLNIIARRLYKKKYDELPTAQKKIVDIEFEEEYGSVSESIIKIQTDEQSPQKKARITWMLATTVTKWIIKKFKTTPRWQLVEFTVPNEGESTGIVDILAIRKSHKKQTPLGLKPGDPFQIILLQIKGGTASKPSKNDIKRLQKMKQLYHADEVVLSEWKEYAPTFYRLKQDLGNNFNEHNLWEKKNVEDIFK